jgi:hypothetical protein
MPSTVILTIGATAITTGMVAIAVAVAVVASTVISKVFGIPTSYSPEGGVSEGNTGNRQQVPPATDNKLPVVYGSAFVGGTVVDLSITSNNQTLYYVFAICEVTGTSGVLADTFTFGDIYWGGKRVQLAGTSVTALIDESTGLTDTSVNGKMSIYLYSNGSYNGYNTSLSAIEVMQSAGLTYTWDNTKLMSDCVFAIVKINYSQTANLTGLQSTMFQVINSRSDVGGCFIDYIASPRYGAGLAGIQIDTESFNELTDYGNELITYTNSSGVSSTQPRFKFNGVIDTRRTIMQNLQDMSSCADCLIKYNEITAEWGVIVQKPTYTVAMALDDSNMVSAIQITPMDLAGSYNIVECKFPDETNQDAFNTATFDLAQIAPSLLFPNEPVNKQSISLPMVNNDVQAQLIANRLLKSAREDLQVQVSVNFSGIQLEAGDIVTVTSPNYGWTVKPFRINKVIEEFADDGAVLAKLTLSEFNSEVYDDADITQFQPAPNTGIGDPSFFGTIPAPSITGQQPNITNPSFNVIVTTASSGITQYAEVWYSAFSNPTPEQLIFAGTTAIQSSGNPYDVSTAMPAVTLPNIPSGNWYFFSRMVNSISSSNYSPASTLLQWRPTTFQYTDRYLVVAYAEEIDGTGFSLDPRNKEYYGLRNQDNTTPSTNPADYTWYLAQPTFGSNVYLAYTNRTGRKFSFGTGFAGFAGGTGAFVPSQSNIYDSSIWQALPDGTNFIDLDARTGQLLKSGTTSVGGGQLQVTNNDNGLVVASLQQFLDFGTGQTTLTGSASTLTIDIYGRVLGFTTPDGFYFTIDSFTATSGQTVFTPTARQVDYIVGQDLVFVNGTLLDTTEYTEDSTTVTLDEGLVLDDQVIILSFRGVSSGITYESLYTSVASVSGAVVTYDSANLPYQLINAGDIITFSNTGTPTQYTVQSVNIATHQITMTTTISGVSTGEPLYRYRANGSSYPIFSRFTDNLTNASEYTPTTWAISSGYELVFNNGVAFNEQDYDLVENELNNFPADLTGNLTVIQFAPNNLTTPAGSMANIVVNTLIGQSTYVFSYLPEAFNLYYNGFLQTQGIDYTTASGSYNLAYTPTLSTNILQQQTFARNGDA